MGSGNDDSLFSQDELEEQEKRLSGQSDLPVFPDLAEIGIQLSDYGVPDNYELFVQLTDIPVGALRSQRFADIGDAINFLFAIGVLGFSRILLIEEEGQDTLFAPVIPDNSPKGGRRDTRRRVRTGRYRRRGQ